MPLYAYHCRACQFDFDNFVRMDGRDVVQCPKCHAPAQRQFSAPHIRTFPIKAVRVNGEEVI